MQNFGKLCIASILTTLIMVFNVQAEPVNNISPKEKCRVCGMFVAKYQPWIAQIHISDHDVAMFDGVKDMMAYYFEPEKFGGTQQTKNSPIYVKDYYTQKWLDGRKAYYVTGSDIMGPMGHEFIPFDSTAAAENFFKDHQGKALLQFDEITLDLVTTMRSGMKMKGMKMHKDHDMKDHKMN
ncbi:nitrous oxide reductase accessory protein NosL [Desulforhopalus sp. IMCC35007]|uniref:nitrous oxide reductase accessory protein NosL n=1 Tax=Desulforhopalus sp. IMCC35007 TaxID=2569543 RepID=UPI0010AE0982|nr:nitrous oxide reductase accessory protein NosL [Desulforhopalus sp. IMCC35007]TKB07278.1 NosL family protein [Desulforhopalus sp. IMCC35007]